MDAFRWSGPIPQLPHENRECLITRDSEVSQLGGPLKCLMARTIRSGEICHRPLTREQRRSGDLSWVNSSRQGRTYVSPNAVAMLAKSVTGEGDISDSYRGYCRISLQSTIGVNAVMRQTVIAVPSNLVSEKLLNGSL